MDTRGNQGTFIFGDYEDSRNNFNTKSSMAGYTEYRERYNDSPKSVKSRAHIICTEMEKQLEVTESEFVSAAERLRYSRLLYDTAGSMSLATNDYSRIDESPLSAKISQFDISSSSHLMNDKNFENNLASGDMRYFKETNSTEQRSRDEIEPNEQSPVYTARSFEKVTSESNIFHDINDESNNDWDSPNNYFSGRVRDGGKHFSYEDSMKNCFQNNANKIREEQIMNDMSPRKQHPYQLHLAEYSKGLQDEFAEESRNDETPTTNVVDREFCSSVIKTTRQQEFKKPVLHLNLSGSTESLTITKKKKKSRTDKQRIISSKIVSKSIDCTIGAITKRKRKKRVALKTSNSRCTTATRDTSISENKKEIRKQKQRDHSSISGLQSPQNRRQNITTKNKNNTREVVEIYHNNAVNSGSISVTSSKHSKLMELRPRVFVTSNKFHQPSRIQGSYRLVDNNNQATSICDDNDEKIFEKEKNYVPNKKTENCENYDERYRKNLQESTDLGSGEPNRTNYQAEFRSDESEEKIIKDYRNNNHQRNNCQSSSDNSSPCNDSLSARNYELPTVASRMKQQVHRSYFNRFNFRNLPFVVGTSVTPSYNLGLNIQEALSLMKARQILHSGITPLLISNVTKGLRPVSTLLGCVRDEDENLAESTNIPYVVNSRKISNAGQSMSEKISRSVQFESFPLKTPRHSCSDDNQKFHDSQECCINSKIEKTSNKTKTRLICSSMKLNQRKNVELTQSTLLTQRQEEINIGDSKWQNVPQGTRKGIREVLMNYSDQYEAMLTKFEKLQNQAKKTKDKTLDKEIASLEKELNAKEEEINAVSSLYQEVMILKQQMRMLHERNSLVCVATESPGSPTYPRLSFRSQTSNPDRIVNLYRRAGSLNNHGPPTSTRLAGLLRQIKTFQKRLKSNA